MAVDDDCDGDVDEDCDPDSTAAGAKGCGGCDSGRSNGGGPAALLVLAGVGVALRRRRRTAGPMGILAGLVSIGCNDAALYKLEADEDPIPDQAWLDFGVVSVGDAASLPLTLRNPGRVDITLTRARVTEVEGVGVDPPLTRTVLSAEGSEDGSEYADLSVQFAPETVGTWDGLLVIDLAGAVSERLAIPVYAAAAAPSLGFAPSVLDVGPTDSSPGFEVALINNGAGTVRLDDVQLPPDTWSVSGLTAGLVLEPGASVPVVVSSSTTERSVESIVVTTGNGETWSMELRANACDLEPVNVQDLDGDGLSPCAGDCDDQDPEVRAGIPDVEGDGVDADCDGEDG